MKKLRHFSLKRQKQNREYTKLRESFLGRNPFCEARVSVECNGKANQIHHKFGRTGNNLTDVSGFLPVCARCHEFIERNPKRAKELGLSENRLS